MWFAPRRVIRLDADNQPKAREDKPAPFEKPIPFEELRKQAAWILLGEPGAGKSKAFEEEAQATQGVFISIAEFLSDALDPSLRGKTLYLDGLDETRAGGGELSALFQIRAYLKKLGSPRFRIACRAADWFGSSDIQAIADILHDGQPGVYALVPLNDGDIKKILRQNHEIPDPETFVKKAHERGIDGLLDNPQTLKLLAEAVSNDGQWPTTRQDTFELACRKLADEDSKKHRDLARTQGITISVEKILTAAGQLCAVLLLSGKSGIALDRESADERFPLVDDFAPDDLAAAWKAISRKLFRPSDAQERVVPSHRSIAEFLAAKWLAERIDNKGLPLGRVLKLLLGLDGRTVAGLRGLYGWLALCCLSARQRLIKADPLTVVIYGGAKPMPSDDKRRLFIGLQQEAGTPNYFQNRWQDLSVKPFGALADGELVEDFASILGTTGRDNLSQFRVACVLDILNAGEPIPELKKLEKMVKAIVLDDAWWPDVRKQALKTWLQYPPPVSEAISLLDAFCFEQNTKDNDELIGILLTALYPENIPAKKLLRYLHAPKDPNVILGHYQFFWEVSVLQKAPESDLPILLDQLAERTDFTMPGEVEDAAEFSSHGNLNWYSMPNALVSRGLQVHGDGISDKKLYNLLGICGKNRLEKEHLKAISDWLAARPERYKAVLALCYQHCGTSEHIRVCLNTQKARLRNVPSPSDIGLWHLGQASLTAHDGLAENHLYEAVNALFSERGCAGLTWEKIEAWGDANPKRRHLLDSALELARKILEYRQEEAARVKTEQLKTAEQRRNKTAEQRRNNTNAMFEHLETIRNGTASPNIMLSLAGAWLNIYHNIGADTIEARFESYFDNGIEVLEAAKSGFFHCPERDDLPNVAEIINLRVMRQKLHLIHQPCLIGMELRWRRGKSFVDCLSEEQLRRMVAFHLAYDANQGLEWFLYLVQTRPDLVAEVLIAYASAAFKAKLDFVYGLDGLVNNDSYRALAELALIPLLTSFPARAKSTLLPYLKELLKAALRYRPKELQGLLKEKLLLKGMDVPQRIYWLAAGMLLDPAQYESELWRRIGKGRDKAWVRANHLRAFVSDRSGDGLGNDYALSTVTLGRLIELLTPHAELEHELPSGTLIAVTEAMATGRRVHAMVTSLAALASEEAAEEINRLLAHPALNKLKGALKHARYKCELNRREKAFRFPSTQDVAAVLSNQKPVNVTDLAALTLDILDQIAYELRGDNSNRFADFWNVEKNKPPVKREENLCRNTLMAWLRFLLKPHGIDTQPESSYFNHKRSDNRLAYRNEFALPIEIKRDNNHELWTAMREQLIKKYAIAPEASGYGIYLVLWFGKGYLPRSRDGKKKPVSAEELQSRLEVLLDPEERSRIFVRVLDVSWPESSGLAPSTA